MLQDITAHGIIHPLPQHTTPMKQTFFFLLLTALLLSACAAPSRETSAEVTLPAEQSTLKYVALTFDDGPRADTTAALLDGLRQRGAAATFFVVGEQIPGNEALIRRMAAEGHQVGNHTYSHLRLEEARDDLIIEEIHKTEVLLTEILGKGDYWLRPPYGMADLSRASLIHTPMIHWSLDTEDWKKLNAKEVTDLVLSEVEAGDIILLHDFYPTSVEAALAIIDALQPRGYAFVTLRDLFAAAAVTPQEGVYYKTPHHIRSQ